MEILSQNQIDALAENYPIGAQEGKGLDTLVCCKLLYPDRRNNPEGYWYITGCTRRGDDVEFEGLCTVAGNVGPRIAPVVFTLSGLERLTSKGPVIEVDNNFTPATVRELQKTEAPLLHYIKAELEKERRALIWASRQDLADTIAGLFLPLDNETGKASHAIADTLVNDVCNDMIGNFKERGPAIIRTIARRLGIKANVINMV